MKRPFFVAPGAQRTEEVYKCKDCLKCPYKTECCKRTKEICNPSRLIF